METNATLEQNPSPVVTQTAQNKKYGWQKSGSRFILLLGSLSSDQYLLFAA